MGAPGGRRGCPVLGAQGQSCGAGGVCGSHAGQGPTGTLPPGPRLDFSLYVPLESAPVNVMNILGHW